MTAEGARPRGERGVGPLGLLFWLGVIFAVVWGATRIVPLYFEYWAISNVFQEQVNKANLYEGPVELRTVLMEELSFQDLERLEEADIEIEELDSGRYRVGAEYREVVPVTERVRILFTFRPEATGG